MRQLTSPAPPFLRIPAIAAIFGNTCEVWHQLDCHSQNVQQIAEVTQNRMVGQESQGSPTLGV